MKADQIIILCDDRGVDPFFLSSMIPDDIPLEIDLLVEGDYPDYVNPLSGKKMPFKVTSSNIDSAVDHFRDLRAKNPRFEMAIDYEHQTFRGGQAPASGWIIELFSEMRDSKKVLRAKLREWTDRAKEYLKNKEYRYISPAFTFNIADSSTGKKYSMVILNPGLTNFPFFKNLDPIVTSQLFQHIIPSTHKESSTMKNLIAMLCKLYKLAEDATEEQIIEKFTEHQELIAGVVQAKAQVFEALGLQPTATIEEAKAKIVTAKEGAASVTSLQERIVQLEQQQLNEKIEAIVAKGVADGKIIPATKESMLAFAKKDLTSFQTYLASAPVLVSPKGIDTGDVQHSSEGLTETDLRIAKQMGVTEEQLKKGLN